MALFGRFSRKGLHNYQILEKIDEGRMSVIHKAVRLSDNEVVALKLLNKDGLTMRRALKKKFPDIDAIILGLAHENIVTTLDIGGQGAKQYICIEYISGLTLGRIAKRKMASVRQLLGYFSQACAGLQYMHEKGGLVHRDFNPQNVIVNEQDVCKIIDLDLAFERVYDTRGIYRRSGTLGYLSPEQVRGRNLDHRIDIYALGASMYEAFSGHNPFRDTSGASTALRREKTLTNHLVMVPTAPSSANSEIPPLLDRVIMKCLRLDREKRYQSVTQVKRDLDRCLKDL
jgi:serine/threonine-protein kinase